MLVTDVAVMVTVGVLGTVAGAVYVTEDFVGLVRSPQELPEHPDPDKFQVTPSF